MKTITNNIAYAITLLLGENYLVEVDYDTLDGDNAVCIYNVSIPQSNKIVIDFDYLEEASTQDMLETIIHECHHVIMQPFQVMLDHDTAVDNDQFKLFAELSADACKFIAMNACTHYDKIIELISKRFTNG